MKRFNDSDLAYVFKTSSNMFYRSYLKKKKNDAFKL